VAGSEALCARARVGGCGGRVFRCGCVGSALPASRVSRSVGGSARAEFIATGGRGLAEDRSVALAAVVVAGIVGVAGPLITWQATQQSQDRAADAEQRRADRADLLKVLDEATSNLASASDRSSPLAVSWANGHRIPRREQRLLAAKVRAVRFSDAQLQLRLGSTSSVFRAYHRAERDLFFIYISLSSDPLTTPPSDAVVIERSNRLDDDRSKFTTAAHGLARSKIE
jgi:hypothetical protein